jgi:hypothetical protein
LCYSGVAASGRKLNRSSKQQQARPATSPQAAADRNARRTGQRNFFFSRPSLRPCLVSFKVWILVEIENGVTEKLYV